MGSRSTEFIKNLGTSVSALVSPTEREGMVRTAAKAAVEGAATEIDSLGPALRDTVPALVADTTASALRGGIQELKSTFPELIGTLKQVREALAQYIEEHRIATENGEPGTRMQRMAEGAVRGATGELRRRAGEIDEVVEALEPGVEMAGRQIVAGVAAEVRKQVGQVDMGALVQEATQAAVAGAIAGLRTVTGALERWRWPAAVVGAAGVLAMAIVVRGRA